MRDRNAPGTPTADGGRPMETTMTGHGGWVRLSGLLLVAATSAACAAPIRVNAYAERGMTVSRYASYDFAPAAAESTGDPRLDSNPFFLERVRAAVDRGLAAKGYTRRTDAPDVLVHFHANVSQNIDIVDVDRKAGYCGDDNCRPFVYDAGTLVVDLVDARTRALAWRGWAESSLDGIIDNQAWMDEKVDAAVARITARLPAAAAR